MPSQELERVLRMAARTLPGVNAYLCKPVSLDSIAAELKRWRGYACTIGIGPDHTALEGIDAWLKVHAALVAQ